jgi:serine/threonine-protein kinase
MSLLEPGSVLARYTVLGKLATGGMSEVYLAQQSGPSGFAKILVLKVILPQLSEDDDFIHMFHNEAKLAALLNHPNVVQIFDFGVEEQVHYMAMEYIDGRDLASIVDALDSKNAAISMPVALRIISDACGALQYAHSLTDPQGNNLEIIHRDVSLDNILVTYSGQVKLVDFGIAKARHLESHTSVGQVRGKYRYMAPELLRGDKLDRRADVFSMGVVIYRCLLGQMPFEGMNHAMLINAIVHKDPPAPRELNPGLPDELERIILKALRKDRERRYQTAGELQIDLEGYLLGSGTAVMPYHLSQYMAEVFPPGTDENRETYRRLTAASIAPVATPSAVLKPTSTPPLAGPHDDPPAQAPADPDLAPTGAQEPPASGLEEVATLPKLAPAGMDEPTLISDDAELVAGMDLVDGKLQVVQTPPPELRPESLPTLQEPSPVAAADLPQTQVESTAFISVDEVLERAAPATAQQAPVAGEHATAAEIDRAAAAEPEATVPVTPRPKVAARTGRGWLPLILGGVVLLLGGGGFAVYYLGFYNVSPSGIPVTPDRQPPVPVQPATTEPREPPSKPAPAPAPAPEADSGLPADAMPPDAPSVDRAQPDRAAPDRAQPDRAAPAPAPAPAPTPKPAPAPAPAPAPEATGKISVQAPGPADVYVNGRKIGSVPLKEHKLPEGKYSLQVRSRKRRYWLGRYIAIKAGTHRRLNLTPQKGTIRVRVRPWARVTLDGKPLGTTPLAPVSVYEGPHTLVLENSDLKVKKRQRVTVHAGKETVVKVRLE